MGATMRLPIRHRLLLGLAPGFIFLLLLAAIAYGALLRIQAHTAEMVQALTADVQSAAQPDNEAQAHAEQYEIVAFIEHELMQTGGLLVVVLGAAVLGGALFAWYFARSIARPLATLEEGARQIAGGHAPPPLPVSRRDEIGALAQSFDSMWRQLDATHGALKELLETRQQELATLTTLTRTVNESTDLNETMDMALHSLIATTHGQAGAICLVENEHLHRASVAGTSPLLAAEAGVSCSCPHNDGEACRWLRGRLPDATHHTTPIKARDRLVGVLHGVASANDDCEQCPPFVEAVAQQLGVAIENARLFAEEQQQRQLAETLRDIAADLSRTLNLDSVLETILDEIGRVLQVDAGVIFLLEEGALRVKAVRGRAEMGMQRWLEYRLALDDAPQLRAVLESQTPHTFCQPNRLSLLEQGIERLETVDWCLVTPLISKGRAIGLLALEQIGHCYDSQEEMAIAATFASHAALAIENARLYQMAQQWNLLLESEVEARTHDLEKTQRALARQSEQLRALLNSTLDIQESERDRIARDIHDGVVQWILCAMYELEATSIAHQRSPEVLVNRLRSIQTTLQHAKDELYQVIHDLHPPLLRSDGLATSLKALVSEIDRSTPAACRLTLQGDVWRLSPKEELAVYRIVQEALRNALTHASAQHIDVRVDYGAEHVCFQVIDDGVGFAMERVANGHLGLVSMQERAQSIAADLSIEGRPGVGARITLNVARQQPVHAEDGYAEEQLVDSCVVG